MYGLVWFQLSHGIKSIIRNNEYIKDRSDVFDCLWLLNFLNEVTSRIDVNLKKLYNIYKAVLNFLSMHQGQHGSDDSFKKCFDANLQTLGLAGQRQILCRKDTMDKIGDYPTYQEVKVEEENFKGMCLLKRSDMLCYEPFL